MASTTDLWGRRVAPSNACTRNVEKRPRQPLLQALAAALQTRHVFLSGNCGHVLGGLSGERAPSRVSPLADKASSREAMSVSGRSSGPKTPFRAPG